MEQEKSDEQKQKENTKDVSRFLLNLIIFASGSLVMKLAWNLGLASLFPNSIPRVSYIHAFTWLTMLYIVSRVVTAGVMGEVGRAIGNLFEDLQDAVATLQSFVQTVTPGKGTKNDSADLN